MREGSEALNVGAKVAGLEARPVVVPPVLVALTDAEGATVYQWSVTPSVRTLIAGEDVRIETQLPRPPAGAVGIKLSFAGAAAAAVANPVTAGAP